MSIKSQVKSYSIKYDTRENYQFKNFVSWISSKYFQYLTFFENNYYFKEFDELEEKKIL